MFSQYKDLCFISFSHQCICCCRLRRIISQGSHALLLPSQLHSLLLVCIKSAASGNTGCTLVIFFSSCHHCQFSEATMWLTMRPLSATDVYSCTCVHFTLQTENSLYTAELVVSHKVVQQLVLLHVWLSTSGYNYYRTALAHLLLTV